MNNTLSLENTLSLDPVSPSLPSRLRWIVKDSMVVAGRSLSHLRVSPDRIFGLLAQPLIFIVLFGYVFGSAISVPGISYREFLIPGVFAMSMAGTMMSAAVGMAEDKSKGIANRLRTMPIGRSVALLGSTMGNFAQALITLAMLAACGLVIGWRTHADVAHIAAGFALLLLLQFAMNWVGIYLGLLVNSTEAADSIGMLVFFPLSFLANTFVPTDGMPAWARFAAEWNPMSAAVAALRELFGNTGTAPTLDSWPMQHPFIASIGWSLAILIVFVPLCIRKYKALSER